MGGKRDCIWHTFKNIISGRKMQFNFQNEWLNQSMTGLYNQYLLPLTLAAFLERSFSKIVLFSATFHCVLCKLFWLVYCIPLFFFASIAIKNLTSILYYIWKNRYFQISLCILFLWVISFKTLFKFIRDSSKYFLFSVFLQIILTQHWCRVFLSLLSTHFYKLPSKVLPYHSRSRFWPFPGGSDSKESPCNTGDLSSISRSRRSPGKGNGYPTPVFLPGELHCQGSLAGYSPWSRKELTWLSD